MYSDGSLIKVTMEMDEKGANGEIIRRYLVDEDGRETNVWIHHDYMNKVLEKIYMKKDHPQDTEEGKPILHVAEIR